ncbi:lamin tail domain-containing protein [Sorangium sp. So ce362]|uniref:lamin tail domain-containing protein n=1 Tax=Sorangium sp. So ce362 TaxID=3133303 RepID=UPI003F6360A6
MRVLDPVEAPALAALDPPSATVAPGGTVSFTVTLDIPSPSEGAVVALALEPPGAGTLPASVAIPGGQQSATFDYVDGGSAAGATVTATLGAISLSATVETVTVTGRLVINEVDYDQENTDGAEFIEIYNGTGGPVDLAGHALVLINGASELPSADQTFDLSPAGTLAAGQYLVVGSTAVVGSDTLPEGALTIPFSGAQINRVQNGAPDGPDGIALVNTTTGSLIDALSCEGSITAVTIGEVSVSLVEGEPLPRLRGGRKQCSWLALPPARGDGHESGRGRLGVLRDDHVRRGERAVSRGRGAQRVPAALTGPAPPRGGAGVLVLSTGSGQEKP